MNQQQLEEWIAANGGQGRVQYRRSSQSVPNPAKKMTREDGTDNPDYDPTAPSTITVNEEKWVAVDAEGKPTGAELHARRRPDGEFDIINQANANPAKPAGGEENPATRNAAILQQQRERNAALPKDQDPAYETDEERRKRAQDTITQQGRDAEAARQRERQDAADARTRDEDVRKREAEARTEAERNKPKPVEAAPGKWGYFDTNSTPPKWVPLTGTPEEAAKPVQVNGQWGVWTPGKDGGVPSFTRVDVPQSGVGIKNVDPWTPDFTKPDLGLGEWAVGQRQKIGLSAEQGGITQADYDNAIKEAHGRGGTTITNLTNAHNTVRQQMLDQEGMRNTRSKESESDFNNALGVFNQVWKYADPKTGSIRNLIPGMMAEQKSQRDARTAEAPQMPALHPMFQMASQQSIATAQPPAAREQAVGTGPTPAPYQPPQAPNELGLGAIGNQPAPGGPPVVPTPPPGAAMPPPTPGEPGGPPLASGPVYGGATPPVIPGAPSAVGDTGAPPVPPPAAAQPAPFVGDPSNGAPYNPPAHMPGHRPGEPIGMQGGPMTAMAGQALGGPAAPPDQGMNPALTTAMAGAQMPQFNPAGAAERLAAQLGVPPEIAAQALAGYTMQQRQGMGMMA